eukprot:7595484-Prorocentrum_lima.AAC.1
MGIRMHQRSCTTTIEKLSSKQGLHLKEQHETGIICPIAGHLAQPSESPSRNRNQLTKVYD